MDNKFVFVLNNKKSFKNIKVELYDGVEHLVLPVIAAKEMVMNEMFYPADVLKDSVSEWEGTVVTMNHPQINNVGVSAKTKRVQELNRVGTFFNTTFTDDNKLKGEIWLNEKKTTDLGYGHVIDTILNGGKLEVSTGLRGDYIHMNSSYKGKNYKKVIKQIRPDHLAILTNEEGACSLKDGCGAMVNNCKEECTCKKEVKKQTIWENINNALSSISEQIADFRGDKKMIANENSDPEQETIKNDGNAEVENVPVEEVPETVSEAVGLSNDIKGDDMSEDLEKKDLTLDEKLDKVVESVEDGEVKEIIGNSIKQYRESLATCVEKIIANSDYTQEELKGLPYSHLLKLEGVVSNKKQPDFSGRVFSKGESEKESPLKNYTPPSIWDKGDK
jgi:hypothetical protein